MRGHLSLRAELPHRSRQRKAQKDRGKRSRPLRRWQQNTRKRPGRKGDQRPDHDVPGEGDLWQRATTGQDDRMRLQPQRHVQRKAGHHADRGTALRRVPCHRAQQKNSKQRAIGH